MRIFDHPNMFGKWICPICKTKNDEPVTLVGIDGTQEGNIVEAVQTHISCLKLTYYPSINMINMNLNEEN